MEIIAPRITGNLPLLDISLETVVPYIHWSFFFLAWKLTGKYEGLSAVCDCNSCVETWLLTLHEADRAKAREAYQLYRDAKELLRKCKEERSLTINACIGFYPARSVNDNIELQHGNHTVVIPTLRQQNPSTDGYCYSLSDFLHPKSDFIGVFATTVLGAETLAAEFESANDIYASILVKTLADRLAEAAAEWLHYQVRTFYWGYSPDEPENISEMWKVHYRGIRPAVGYPSLPDQSVIFDMASVLPFEKIGITLTENGAMYPNASVCGLYFAHPLSKYFMIGRINEEQLIDYAQRKSKSVDETRKWLAANL